MVISESPSERNLTQADLEPCCIPFQRVAADAAGDLAATRGGLLAVAAGFFSYRIATAGVGLVSSFGGADGNADTEEQTGRGTEGGGSSQADEKRD